MKVGILTYHFSHNYGAVLQCYALQTALQEEGYDVVVIDYITEEQLDNVSTYRKINSIKSIVKNIVLTPFHFRRERKRISFESFQREQLILTKRVRNQAELDKLIKEDRITHVIVGSDQVWNPGIKEFDKSFFLTNISEVIKIGYSVSLGHATSKELTPFVEYANRFNEITAREKSASQILSRITNRDITITPDPTFLISREYWMEYSNKRIQNKKNYLICYFLNKEKYRRNIEFSKQLANEYGLKLVLIDPRVSFLSILNHGILEIGPSEFLNLIYNSRFVVTDSFHGTVFSVLLNKQFISINNDPGSTDTRRSDLLNKYGLIDSYLTTTDLNSKDLIGYNCDFTIANKVMDEELNDNRQKLIKLLL